MLVAVDLDNTVATDTNQYASYLNNILGLGISDDRIQAITMYGEFEQLPEVQEYLVMHKDAYLAALSKADASLEIMATLSPLPGAAEALQGIAGMARIIYVTCRKTNELEVSRQWLSQHGFPAADQVYTCEHYEWKYIHAYVHAQADDPIMLIDDRADRIVERFRYLIREYREIATSLYKRLSVFAFDPQGELTFSFKVPFPVETLRSWQKEDMTALYRGLESVAHL